MNLLGVQAAKEDHVEQEAQAVRTHTACSVILHVMFNIFCPGREGVASHPIHTPYICHCPEFAFQHLLQPRVCFQSSLSRSLKTNNNY